MSKKLIPMIGKKFGRLTVISRAEDRIQPNGKNVAMYLCKCKCGRNKIIYSSNLRAGYTNSCGCLQKEINSKNKRKHGLCGSRFYSTWSHILSRCFNKYDSYYYRYGNRGITVCNKWLKFENFKNDMYESYINHYKKFGNKNTTIERIDNNGNYCKENCRWATYKEQSRNRSTNILYIFNGETKTQMEWSEITGINRNIISRRINKLGWSVKKALTTPVKRRYGIPRKRP